MTLPADTPGTSSGSSVIPEKRGEAVASRVAVVGTGYIGTVAATCLASVGREVVGLEIDEGKLDQLQRGIPPFFENGLPELLASSLASGRLWFTADPAEAMANSDVVFLCVGTPPGLDGRPNLADAEAAASVIGRCLNHHHVMVHKSTVPIGSGGWLASVVRDSQRAASAGVPSFSVVANPEFLRQGSAIEDFLHPERIVLGSDDPRALATVVEVYRPIIEQSFNGSNGRRPFLVTTDLVTAEAIKYASNAFLATKISFINEVANICDRVGADVATVGTAMGLDSRIGNRFLDPGLGWGGSCFGKDLAGLIVTAQDNGYEPELLKATAAVNARQRRRVTENLLDRFESLEGRRVGVLGLAFKPGTDDLRDAPAVTIAWQLLASGATVIAHDPVVRSVPGLPEVEIVDDPYAVADDADAVVLVTEWPEYRLLDLVALRSRMRGRFLLDGRNCLDPYAALAAGLEYQGVGRPGRVPTENVSAGFGEAAAAVLD